MAETHIDNTSAGFRIHQAERKQGKTIWQRLLLCFHHILLVPIGLVIFAAYINYNFFTDPEFLSMPLILGFILFVVGQIFTVILYKMTYGDRIAELLREVFR